MRIRFLLPVILLATLSFTARAASDSWMEIRSEHFTVLTDAGERQGRHIADQFERMRWMFQTLYPKLKVDPSSPIVVLAAKNGKSFQALEPSEYLAKGQLQLGGLFLKTQDKNYVLLRLDVEEEHPFATVYHEYTHLMFSGYSEWLPLWLNEGLAEFYQNTDIHNKDVQLGQPSLYDILYLRQNKLIPLATLLKVDARSPYYHEENKGSVFYAESWALTHYLMMTDHQNHTELLQNYMILLSQHVEGLAAAQKAFGDLKQLQHSLDDYIQQGHYMQFILSSAAAPLNDASYQVRTLNDADANAVRADFLASIGRTADAEALLKPLLSPGAGSAQARETMGYLAFRAGDMEAARKWYEQALKLDSQSYLAQYYFASMSLRAGSSSGPVDDTQIEASLRNAIRLNPSFAPACEELASFYGQRNKNLEEAHALSQKAIELDRGNLVYRLNAANVLMEMGKYEDAVTLLRNSANLARNPSEAIELQERITQVQRSANYGPVHTGGNASEVDDADGADTVPIVVENKPPAQHPDEAPSGPKHEATGTIHSVECHYPASMEFLVDTPKKTILLYSNNYHKIDLSVVGFTPAGPMNLCKEMEGLKGKVLYAESSDKSVDGQVIAIELSK